LQKRGESESGVILADTFAELSCMSGRTGEQFAQGVRRSWQEVERDRAVVTTARKGRIGY
jgi:hypothetical protein